MVGYGKNFTRHVRVKLGGTTVMFIILVNIGRFTTFGNGLRGGVVETLQTRGVHTRLGNFCRQRLTFRERRLFDDLLLLLKTIIFWFGTGGIFCRVRGPFSGFYPTRATKYQGGGNGSFSLPLLWVGFSCFTATRALSSQVVLALV